MFLASKAAWAGIVFILVTTGILKPPPTPLGSGANVSKKVPAAGNRDDVKQMQHILRDKGHYAVRSMASPVSEPGRAFADCSRLKICQSQGSLIRRRPLNSESDPRVARRVATRQRKVNLLQA